jgi:small subunit ribosomal protein S9
MMNPPLFAKTVGRRKTAVANLKLIPGSGQINVNGYSVREFFSGRVSRLYITKEPFRIITNQTFDANVKIQGGGLQRQAEALKLALSRALVRTSPKTKYLFREHSFLTRDSRKKERRKYGLKKARKSKQFSKRLCIIYIQLYLFYVYRRNS